ncbi:proline-rich receptor protein [Salix suchowensis]|nr:proline-rich receptor protein [Salix suchowensis]
MSVLAVSNTTGLSRRVWYLFLQLFINSCFVISITNADLADHQFKGPTLSPSRVPLDAPAIPDLPLPANLPLLHKPRKKHLSPRGAPTIVVAPAHPPNHAPLITFGHPPTSSRLSKSSMKKNGLVSPSVGLVDVAPPQSGDGTNPTGLAQPPLSPSVSDCCKPDMVLKRGSHGCHCVYPIKLDLLLLNISQNPNWNMFLERIASQLGLQVSQIEIINFYVVSLSRLNISMDILPHTGISFSASDASAINSSLTLHKVHFDSTLVGGYKLLNLTWFEPPAPSPAPIVSSSPVKAPVYQSSTPSAVGSSKKGKHTNLILILGIGAGIVIIAIVSILIICSCTFRKGKPKASSKETEPVNPGTKDPAPAAGSLPHPSSTRFLAYEELKEATNNFEPASILGEGGFGRVFKGVLSDGTAVAIKRLTNGGQQGDKEFLVEVEMLSRLHHRNLVKLVGYYSSRDSSQNLLCYELVPNGSLEAWLHGPLGVNCPLDWDTRMKIALDAARGLTYLHEDSQPCVIHRDFKASNILLENNFNAKVADFGLAKQAPEGGVNYLSTRVMGTFGYVAPEYAMTGHLLVKSDVYSYGVVLLELLTGRKPVDMSQPSGQENLVTWARPILRDKDRLEELVDPRLGGKYPKEDFVRVCTIAAACVAPEASQRPSMGEVVQSLKMVQRVMEYQDSMLASNARANLRQSSTTFESDGTSSMFSSGPCSGLSAFDNDNISRTAVFSEDLHEGR